MAKYIKTKHMNEFVKYIHNISPLDDEAKADIEGRLESKDYKKGDIIISEHRVCENLFFLKSGLVKLYFIGDGGKEIILRFFSESSPFSSLESFLGQNITPHTVLALEPTNVDFISKQNIEDLCQKYHSFERFYRLTLSRVIINMINRISELMKDDATTRYNKVVSKNNALMQRISLGDLANYLGITQVSLSRIRASR
jgi:CRP-like cAMP-binding protein